MSNMSYCRFQNTAMDLQDCVEALEMDEELSREEKLARDEMAELCQRFLDEYERIIEFEEEEEEQETTYGE